MNQPALAYLLPLWLCLAAPAPIQAADPFTKITSDPVVSSSASSSLAWGDFNNDGYPDLYVNTLNSAQSLFYSNNGNGTFTRIVNQSIGTDVGNAFGAAWADYDNDGYLDLFVAVNSAGNDWLYHNNGNGTFTKITSGAIVVSVGTGNNCTWGDYDNDGFVDLFVANSQQNDFLYHNNGNGTFTRVTNGVIAEKPGNSQGGMWGDYDNDGALDLMVTHPNEVNLLYHNEGNGVFTIVTNGAIVGDSGTQGTSWGDYDNDGYLDMFIANPGKQNLLYRNNRDGTFTKITNSPVALDVNGSSGVWGDYDNDGYLDLFVTTRSVGVIYLYHNNGDGTFTRVTGSIVGTESANSFTAGWADYNNDGFLDLFVSSIGGFNNALYRNNGNSNAWITVQCQGRLSNRAAIGTKVRLRTTIAGKPLRALREISGGGALGSQNEMRAQFGLGDATNVEALRFEWPSGVVQELRNLAPKQFLTIVEPTNAVAPLSQEVLPGTNVMLTFSGSIPDGFSPRWTRSGTEIPGETNAQLILTNVHSEDAGTYTVLLTNAVTGEFITARPSQLLVAQPATILVHPRPQFVRPGSNAFFSVTAAGYGTKTFQWFFNDIEIGGATNSSLNLSNIQLSHEGIYSVTVSNVLGGARSTNAPLFILVNPVIYQSPLSQTVVQGGSITLSASASGRPGPLTYRWLSNGVMVSRATLNDSNCFFTITNMQPTARTNTFYYRVSVTNLAGLANSASVPITVLLDSDHDGIPDDWELSHNLDPLNAADALLDSDGDGLSNLQEYLIGTDPQSAESSLHIDAIQMGSNGWASIRFAATSNKTYQVEAGTAVGAWETIHRLSATATNQSVEILDQRSSNAFRFYRLVSPASNGP
ncbi:MAG: hypothetical protein JWM16_2548 [Verrucomicrobiales bacterium]|nr:hypothetical protein [Verrucomicrobiales bacterium]